MRTKITIKKVEIHDGKNFKGTNWKSPMQVIYTEKGLLIDNIKGKCFLDILILCGKALIGNSILDKQSKF